VDKDGGARLQSIYINMNADGMPVRVIPTTAWLGLSECIHTNRDIPCPVGTTMPEQEKISAITCRPVLPLKSTYSLSEGEARGSASKFYNQIFKVVQFLIHVDPTPPGFDSQKTTHDCRFGNH